MARKKQKNKIKKKLFIANAVGKISRPEIINTSGFYKPVLRAVMVLFSSVNMMSEFPVNIALSTGWL